MLGLLWWCLHVFRSHQLATTTSWDEVTRWDQLKVVIQDNPLYGQFGNPKGNLELMTSFLEAAFHWIEEEAALVTVYYGVMGLSLMMSIFRLFKMVRFQVFQKPHSSKPRPSQKKASSITLLCQKKSAWQPELNIVMDTMVRSRTNMFSFALIVVATVAPMQMPSCACHECPVRMLHTSMHTFMHMLMHLSCTMCVGVRVCSCARMCADFVVCLLLHVPVRLSIQKL